MAFELVRSSDEVLEYTVEGQIVTLAPASADQQGDFVSLTIDGKPVTVPRVVIARDADHNPLLDDRGRAVYRYTTLYDAATELFAGLDADDGAARNPIPILCHREHLAPVGVCRICVVEVCKSGRAEDKLAPACKRICDDGVDVKTAETSDRVRRVVRTLTELLSSDQPDSSEHSLSKAARHGEESRELSDLARRFEAPVPPRFPNGLAGRKKDKSSPVITINHAACVLCDRCVRACTDVRHNFVIGRTGRGYDARIGFDFDDPMGDSSCVSCGECAISCPTDAITLNEAAVHRLEPGDEALPWQELAAHPLFRDVPPKFLSFNRGAFWRRTFEPGETVCREGEYGSTAFLIERGRFGVSIAPTGEIRKERGRWFDLLGSYRTVRETGGPQQVAELTPADLLFGEMTCLSNYPRAATVTALEEGCSVIALRRNMLYMLKRNAAARQELEQVFRRNAISSFLREVNLFAKLKQDPQRFHALVEALRPRVQLVQVNPKQVIYREGDRADNFDMVRVGFVQVSQTGRDGTSVVRSYVGPRGTFGELALLTRMPEFAASGRKLPEGMKAGRRSATMTAVDHVELVRLRRAEFEDLYRYFPEIGEQIDEQVTKFLASDGSDWDPEETSLGDFLEQGLVNARSLLVLDLEKCTRCDECTKACADTHKGTTRLIRDGLRYDRFLVASSCRACQDPYCMVGCPVDAIHRGPTGEMRIENWCIGCRHCENGCPYGNITMQEVPVAPIAERASQHLTDRLPIFLGGRKAELRMQATLCDLCSDTPGREPSCVYACPHDAAHRMTGKELLSLVRPDAV